MAKGWTIGNETFRTTQEFVERIVTLDEGNGVLLDYIRDLEEALHQCVGSLKALGAQDGCAATAARAALYRKPIEAGGRDE